MAQLASIHLDQKRDEEARPLPPATTELRRKMFGAAHDTQSRLRETLAGLGRHAEAEPLLLAAQEKLPSRTPTLPGILAPCPAKRRRDGCVSTLPGANPPKPSRGRKKSPPRLRLDRRRTCL